MAIVNSILTGQLSARGRHDEQAAPCELLRVENLTTNATVASWPLQM